MEPRRGVERIDVGDEEGGSLRRALTAILIGLVLVGGGISMYVDQGQAMEDAVTIDATVVDKRVDERTSAGSDGSSSDSYYPVVTYKYMVGGKMYESSNYHPGRGEDGMSQGNAQSIVDEYEVGETVTAYYDPDDPSRAFLVKQRSFTPLIAAGLGVVFALLGVVGSIRAILGRLLSRRRPARPDDG